MSGNFPSGFEGFQARMEATIEACGGDDLARMAVERSFRAELERAVRKRESELNQGRKFEYPRPHHGSWLAATAPDFDLAAAEAEASHQFELEADPDIPEGQQFKIVWGGQAIARAARRGGIILAKRSRTCVTLTDAGYALAVSNGIYLRSHHRTFGSEEAAKAFFPRLAEREFKL